MIIYLAKTELEQNLYGIVCENDYNVMENTFEFPIETIYPQEIEDSIEFTSIEELLGAPYNMEDRYFFGVNEKTEKLATKINIKNEA